MNIGSLTGSGDVINAITASGAVTAVRTLNIGFDNTSYTFDGRFARFSDGFTNAVLVNKIGTGTMTLTGVSTNTGNLQVSQGGVTFSGSGTGVFGVYRTLPGATLTLNNSGTNVDNRLGGTATLGTLSMEGGNFRFLGNAVAATSETVGTFNFTTANSHGPSIFTFEPAGQNLTFNVGTTFSAIGQGTALIRGLTGASGKARFNIGSVALGGTGANGTTTISIRPDLLGDASPTGLGTGFIVKDSVTNDLRIIAASEQVTTFLGGVASTNINAALSTNLNLAGSTAIGSLTLNSAGGLTQLSVVTPAGIADGLNIAQTINTGGNLAFTGNAGINVGRITTTSNAQVFLHTLGNLSLTGVISGTSGGLTKDGTGNLTLSSKSLYTSNSNFTGGTTTLAGGDNTLLVLLTAGLPTVSNLSVNFGATLDLNGNNQATNALFTSSNALYAGQAGIITNTGANATLTVSSASVQTWGGTITGNINFTKTGNNALTLTNANTYTGVTTVRANTLTLIDNGSLTGTAYNINFATLSLDNSGLTPLANLNPQRLNGAAPVNLTGGTLQLTPGGSIETTHTVASVALLGGYNAISVPTALAGTAALTITNLLRTNPNATVNFVGGSGGGFNAPPGLGNTNVYVNAIDGTAIQAPSPGAAASRSAKGHSPPREPWIYSGR